MTEILTESFCERCGTRYTFETVAPRQKRLGGLKTLGRGLKTFVLSDDTSLDEALASARSDDEREITSHQLDAFHKTFNFCMNCRQYTCANCWNPIEARCLSCAPRGDQVLGEAPLHLAVSGTLEQMLAPSEPALAVPAQAEPAAEHEHERLPEPDLEPAATEWQLSDDILRRLGSVAGSEAVMQTNGVERDVEELMATPAEPTMAAASEEEPSPAELLFETAAAEAAAEAAAATEATARAAAEETTAMLGRFRPGQSLDDEIAAYEATVGDEVPAPEAERVGVPGSVGDEAEPVTEIIGTESEGVAAEIEPSPQPELVFDAHPEPVAEEAAPQPEPVQPEPQPEPVAADAEPSPEPPAPAPRRDVVEQPAWPRPSVPTAAPGAEPQWPTGPRWPTAIPAQPTPAAPTLSRPAAVPPPLTLSADLGAQATASSDPLAFLSARRVGEAMWAASAQDVLAPAGPAGNVPTGVRSCVSCGLSLSATARFCRRCGTRQDEG